VIALRGESIWKLHKQEKLINDDSSAVGERESLIQAAKKHRVDVVTSWFTTSLEDRLARNQLRPDDEIGPENVIRNVAFALGYLVNELRVSGLLVQHFLIKHFDLLKQLCSEVAQLFGVELIERSTRNHGDDSPAFSGRPLPEQTPAGLWVVDHGKVAATYGSRWH
jgi:hypothetical protein